MTVSAERVSHALRQRAVAVTREQADVSVVDVYTPKKLKAIGLVADRLPRHIAVIMDGNGRWARSRRLPRIEGHRRGVKSVRIMVEECSRLGIGQLTLYCLSSENWKRPKKELDRLLHLLEQYVIEERSEIMRAARGTTTAPADIGRRIPTARSSRRFCFHCPSRNTPSLTIQRSNFNPSSMV